ncbi:DUF642 domain-containing protein [Duganella radicis]|uniref:DUF642 domain-containing protein n=1 Tax=Duganella radicis TaxID=551988 RepID=A0A6L6PBA9_9BURK|nr:DUF642 domain-containing protein [Duganella radicis]MTV36240.1 DUF642 domain-containing protein [Duganella radicis]
MFLRKFFSASALVLMAASSQAAVIVFNDNFDADKTTNNVTQFVHGWTVSNGTVDLDGQGFVHNELPGHGHYVDLDGSTNQAGLLSNSISLTAGYTYTLSFGLAGNQRNWGDDTVDVTFGNVSKPYLMHQADALTTYTIDFKPTVSAVYQFSFHNRGGDNRGAFLDNVAISAVPEPDGYAMLLTGLAAMLGMTMVARRRR